MSLLGSTWSSKDAADGYVLCVVAPTASPGWWRCLVLVDDLDIEEEGSLLCMSEEILEGDFERVS